MADAQDKTIGQLPAAQQVTSDSLIPVEQAGVAQKMTGAQFQAWASAGAAAYSNSAQGYAAAAELSRQAAEAAADTAEGVSDEINSLQVTASTLAAGSSATVSKSVSQGVVTLAFGIPRGNTGAQGATGATGAQGVQGPRGGVGAAVAVETSGMYYFHVDQDPSSPTFGHLFLTYTGSDSPAFSINENGHLIWTVS